MEFNFGATNYEYHIADNLAFANAVVGTTSSLNTVLSTLQNSTTYYWRVRATNGLGNSHWSLIWSFTTTSNVGFSENS